MRIWVVDDQDAVLEVLARALTMRGHQVEVFSSAHAVETAVRGGTKKAPAVMLIDQTLGLASGAELAREIRAAWPGTAVVLMSGDPEALNGLPAEWTGLKKPFGLGQLRQVVETARLRGSVDYGML